MSAVDDIRWLSRRFQSFLDLTEKLEKYETLEAYEAELSAVVDRAKDASTKAKEEHAAQLAAAQAELDAAQGDVSKAQSQAKSARMKAREDAAQIVADAQAKAEELVAIAVAQVERLTTEAADLKAQSDKLSIQNSAALERLAAVEAKVDELKGL